MNINKCLWITIIVYLMVFAPRPVMAISDQQKKMLDQLDQLDKLDHLDFIELKEKADACIRARDFDCAEKKIAKAAKSVSSSQDKKTLSLLKQRLAAERRVVQEERAAAAERERQIQLAEERGREQEERAEEDRRRAQREQDNEESSKAPNAFAQMLQEHQKFTDDLNKISNNSMQDINRIVEEKKANERAAREQRERNERAVAEQRAEARAQRQQSRPTIPSTGYAGASSSPPSVNKSKVGGSAHAAEPDVWKSAFPWSDGKDCRDAARVLYKTNVHSICSNSVYGTYDISAAGQAKLCSTLKANVTKSTVDTTFRIIKDYGCGCSLITGMLNPMANCTYYMHLEAITKGTGGGAVRK